MCSCRLFVGKPLLKIQNPKSKIQRYGIIILLILVANCFLIPSFALKDYPYFLPETLEIGEFHDQVVKVKGLKPSTEYTLQILDPRIAEITKINKELNIARVFGKSLGETILLLVTGDGRIAACRVVVKKVAGKILKENLLIRVTGNPAPGNLLSLFLIDTVKSALTLEALASIEIGKPDLPSLPLNHRALLNIPVKIWGENYIPVSGNIKVAIRNEVIDNKDDDYLMMSNDPEVIKAEGILFRGILKNYESARLLFYHVSKEEYNIETRINNLSSDIIDVLISKGIGGPDRDGIYAGHMAVKRFLENFKSSYGEIIRIEPNSSYIISSQRVSKGKDVATGIVRAWLLCGEGAALEVIARGRKEATALKPIYNKKEDGRISGILDQPNLDICKEYKAGCEPLVIRIGESPTFVNRGSFDLHLGNYGILHRINLRLTNGTSFKAERVALSYASLGGPARGIFVIEDRLFETGFLNGEKVEEKFFELTLPPNTQKTLSIILMPQPGSYYPTNLIVSGTAFEALKAD